MSNIFCFSILGEKKSLESVQKQLFLQKNRKHWCTKRDKWAAILLIKASNPKIVKELLRL